MRLTRIRQLCPALCGIFLFVCIGIARAQTDPLPSWNNTASKRSIIAFVEKVTKPGTSDFVPVADRIATFDNDGTLWVEQPMYVQLAFAFARVKQLAPQHPEWKRRRNLSKACSTGDMKAMPQLVKPGQCSSPWLPTLDDGRAVSEIVSNCSITRPILNFTNLITSAYINQWWNCWRIRGENGFKTYIVSGGQGFSLCGFLVQKAYGIPP